MYTEQKPNLRVGVTAKLGVLVTLLKENPTIALLANVTRIPPSDVRANVTY